MTGENKKLWIKAAFPRQSIAWRGRLEPTSRAPSAPAGKMIVYGALSTHRQTEPDKLTLPLFARSIIYETKITQGFWLYRWFTTASPDQVRIMIGKTVQLVGDEILRIPEGQPFKLQQFADAVNIAEAPAHGGKPLFVFAS